MGIISSPSKYEGGVSDSSILDGDIENPLIKAILNSILDGTPLLDNLLPVFTNNFKTLMDRYYNHPYVFGKPGSGPMVAGTGQITAPVTHGNGGSPSEKFYPVAPIITQYRSLVDEYAADRKTMYEDSSALLDILGLGLGTLDTALRSSASYRDIWASDLYLGVDLASQEENSQLYLYEYYLGKYYSNNQTIQQYSNNVPAGSKYRNWIGEGLDNPSAFGYVENYSYEYYKRLNGPEEIDRVQLNLYAHIDKKVVRGVLGSIGSITTTFNKEDNTWYHQRYTRIPYHVNNPIEWGTDAFHVVTDADDKYFVDIETLLANIATPILYWDYLSGPHLKIRKQTSATHYTEIMVFKPFTAYRVIRSNDKWQVSNDLTTAPVDKNILDNKMTAIQAAMLLQDALMLHIEVAAEYQERFYEKGSFGNFLKIVAVIITLVTLGTGSPVSGGLMAIAEELAINLVIQLGASYIAELLAEHFGFVGAIVAMAVAYAYVNKIEGVNLASSLQGLPWASELLMAVKSVVQAVGEELAESFAELVEETEEFLLLSEERTAELEAAQALLGTSSDLISGFDLLNSTVRPVDVEMGAYESPDNFYNRTVHSQNPGILGLVAVQYYVDGSLVLPRTHQLTDYGSAGQRASADGLLI